VNVTGTSLPEILINLFNHADEKIFVFNRDNKIITMNQSAKDILRDEAFYDIVSGNPQAICRACRGFMTEEHVRTCESCYISNTETDFTSFQVYLDTKDKDLVPFTASFQKIDKEKGIRVLMLRDLSIQLKTQEVLRQKLQVNQVMNAQEEERKRISRELHDSVAQEMLSLLTDIRVLKYMTTDNEIVKNVRSAEAKLTSVLEDIQNISVELRPATLDDLGLESAFRAHFKTVLQNYGLIVNFKSNLESTRYNGDVETAVYRICQEAVLNVVKYAQVDEVEVVLQEKGDYLLLRVIDRGLGFQVNKTDPEGTGLGIYGMKERAELINGNIHIYSERGKGTQILLDVPLKKGSK